MKAAMYAIIKKDFRIIASNRRLFPALFIVASVDKGIHNKTTKYGLPTY